MMRTVQEVVIAIARRRSEDEDLSFQEYNVSVGPEDTVLDCLERIRIEQDSSLIYRHSCHHSSCGTCACIINGVERLACATKISSLENETIKIEPLRVFKPISDCIVDLSTLFLDIPSHWSYLRVSEEEMNKRKPVDVTVYKRFENCIECGSCVSSCPVMQKARDFVGPALLAMANREIENGGDTSQECLDIAGKSNGVDSCDNAYNCSRVCPTGVYPARHIQLLRKKL